MKRISSLLFTLILVILSCSTWVHADLIEPVEITGLYNSSKGGDIRWSRSSDAQGYVIYRTNAGKRVKLATVGASQTSFIDTSIRDNCWGRVFAYSVAPIINDKEWSRCEEKPLQRVAPMKITKLTSDSINTVSVQYTIATGSNKAHGYEIQFARSKSDLEKRTGSFKAVTMNGRDKVRASISGLTGGSVYYFRVRAYVNYTHSVTKKTTQTWSQFSNVVAVKVRGNYIAPTPTPTPTPTGNMCWIPATGKCYHSVSNCGRMDPNKAAYISISEAISRGYTRCPKCW